jgi:hypothetical protein
MANEFRIKKGLIVNETDLYVSGSKLGIGTDTPPQTLTVAGNISGSGTLDIDGELIVSRGSTSGKQTVHDVYIGGTGLASSDSAIYIGNQGDGTGYGWELYYVGSASGNLNKLQIKSENLGSPKIAIDITQDGNVTLPQDLTVGGKVTAEEFHTEFVSASIIYQSGSTKFGDTSDDVHSFSGSVSISGSAENLLTLRGMTPTGAGGLKVEDPTAAAYGAHFTYLDGGTEVSIGGITNNTRNDVIRLDRDTTQTVKIDNTGVGIGTSSPDSKLHVESTSSSTSPIITVENDNDIKLKLGTVRSLAGTAPDTSFIAYDADLRFLADADGVTEVVRFDSSGNVGIGTTTPPKALSVEGGDTLLSLHGSGNAYIHIDRALSARSSYIAFTTNGDMTDTYPTTNLNWALGVTDSDVISGDKFFISQNHGQSANVSLVIDTNDNVGIGTTSPSTKLHLYESGAKDVIFRITPANASYDSLIQLLGQGNDPTVEGFEIWYDNNVGDVHLSTTYNDNAAAIRFHTKTGASKSTSNERMTINGDGKVGIGTTSPATTLDVDGDITANSFFGDTLNLNSISTNDEGTEYTWFDSNSSSSGTTWYKVADITLGAGSFSGVTLEVEYYYPNSNHGSSADIQRYFGSVRCTRSSGTDGDTDDAEVNFTDANRIRVVRTALGVYELQARANVNNRGYGVTYRILSSAGATITPSSSKTAGSTSGTVYTGSPDDGLIYKFGGTVNVGSDLNVDGGTLFVDSINNEVGIGTTSPDALLHIGGAIPTSAEALNVRGNSASTYAVSIEQDNSTGYGVLIDTDGTLVGEPALNVKNSSTSMLYVGSNGNVGIGTTSPDATLEVSSLPTTSGDARYEMLITEDNTASAGRGGGLAFTRQGIIYGGIKTLQNTSSDDNTSMYFQTRGSGTVSNRMIIDESGNVGIGTTSPNDKLHVAGNLFIEDSSPEITLETGATHYNWQIAAQENVDAGLEFSVGSQDADASNDTFSPLMTIKNTGNVGIGTTNPENKLHVQQSGLYTGIHTTAGIRIKSDGASGNGNYHGTIALSRGTGTVAISAVQEATDSDVMGMAFFTHPSTTGGDAAVEQMRIDQNGDLLIGGTSKLTGYSGTFRTLSIQPPSGDNASILELAGNRNANPGNQNAMIQFFNKTGTATEVSRISSLQGSDVTSGSITFNTNDSGTFSEKVRIQSDGNVGIGTSSPVANAKITNMGNMTFGIPGNGSNTSGRFISIEGSTDASGEGSGRIFFSEHNSTTAAMSKYGMSIGYRGGGTTITGADGNDWTGLASIGNGEWGMWGHDNNATGALIMYGPRSGASVTVAGDLFVNDYARIDALRVGTTSTDPGDGNLYVEGNSQHEGTVGYTSFNSGFGGNGWRIDQNANAEFQNLTVRGTFSVYELLAQQIRATNGSLLVATSGKVDTSTGGSTGTLTFDTGNVYGHGFLANDILLAQRLATDGTSLKQTFLRVDTRVDSGSLTYTVLDGSNPEAGQEFVRIGNTTDTDRQGHIYLTADDSNAPYIGVRDGVDAYTDFTSGTGSVEKVRVGRLDGVTSTTFGSLNGYGLWASGSVYLEGGISATFGDIGGFGITQTAISSSNDNLILRSNGQITASAADISGKITAGSGQIADWTITSEAIYKKVGNVYNIIGKPDNIPGAWTTTWENGLTVGKDSSNRMWFSGDQTGNHYEMAIYSASTYIVRLGTNENKIAGWTIDNSAIYSGTKDTSGYSTSGITLNSGGSIHTPNFYVDTGGNAFFKGTLSAPDGNIGGFTIASSQLHTGTKSTFASTAAGVYVGTDGIALGTNSPFNVNSSGDLVASSATITGNITAETGELRDLDVTGTLTMTNTSDGTITSTDGNYIISSSGIFLNAPEGSSASDSSKLLFKGTTGAYPFGSGFTTIGELFYDGSGGGLTLQTISGNKNILVDSDGSLTLQADSTVEINGSRIDINDPLQVEDSLSLYGTAGSGATADVTFINPVDGLDFEEGGGPTGGQTGGDLTISGGKGGDVIFENDDAANGGDLILKAGAGGVNTVGSGAPGDSGSILMYGLSNQASEATALMINGSNVVGTRELGANAFTSAITVGTGLDITNATTAPAISLDLTEITLSSGLDSTATGLTLDLTEVTANSATSNAVLTNDGDGTLTAETNLTYGGTDLTNAGGGYIVDRATTNFTVFKGLDTNDNGIQMGIDSSGDFYIAPVNTGTTDFSDELRVVSGLGWRVDQSLGVGVAPNATNGRIDAGNDVVAFSSSDKRLKENINPISNSLSKIEKISGVEFDWKPLTEEERKTIHGFQGHDVGVIAQEIEEVLPEVVTERENGYKAVKYEKIVPLLIEGIKELKQENDILRKELEDIKKILKV